MTFAYFIIVILLIGVIVVSLLYYIELKNKTKFQNEILENNKKKEEELFQREKNVIDKELCVRELTKAKTIQASIYNILQSDSSKITQNEINDKK